MKVTQLTCSTLLIFAANELGWTDLTDVCDGLHHTQCPVEATRIYNKRWHTFLKTYLKGASPLGNITRVWFRQEDQARSSLHVHAAIWVDPDTIKEDAIVGTAPRVDACSTRAQRAWRKFVLKVFC